MKKEFIVFIEETATQAFKVMAEDANEAEIIGIKNYKDGAFVLDNPHLTEKCISVQEAETGRNHGWSKF